MPICPLPNRWNAECRNPRCGYHLGCVYGLLDVRIGDIFYVGSTTQAPGTRYSAHMHAKYPSNFREAWIMDILADGSLPVFLSLFETQTGECEQELKQIERAIADELRAMGHTAMCDTTWPYLHVYHGLCPFPRLNETYWEMKEHAIAEYLDRVNEQARIQRWLREL